MMTNSPVQMRLGALFRSAAMAALIAASSAFSDTATAETLNQALSAAYTYNPRIDAERARLRATDESVPQARSGYLPFVEGNADLGVQDSRVRFDDEVGGGRSGRRSTPRGYDVSVQQNLFNGFRTTNLVNQAEANVRAGRENLREIERQVLFDAVTAYMDVVRDQAIVGLQENNVNVLSRELSATQDRFEVGEVTRTDVAQAQARRAGAVSDLDLARANLKSSRARYERVIGSPPSNLREPTVPYRLMPKTLEAAIARAEHENPLIITALYLEQAASYNVDTIRGELLPTVTLEARYQDRFESSDSIAESETTTVTGRINVPIYQGGEVSARVRAAKHTHVSRLQDIEDVRTQVREVTVTAWSQYQAAVAQIESDKVQVTANQTALAGVREEEKVGQRTLLDVLNAEQELLNSQVQLETSRRNLIVAAYGLLSSVGRLDAATLGVASEVYDPEAHYFEVRRKWWGISITHADGRRENLDLWDSHGSRQSYK
ncbi:outer membrane protein [Filomicrobium insigne]|uniref:Outer membrane protein n=1 Tax=Filomicrobium insigne TaxID=418854 RepID=A0A1H0QBI5_9HYPH|nr:TolC family outer membrane protein [Filomicrobium insigne]SDP14435.1 outer membrane protein [Filomicrobium insigne]